MGVTRVTELSLLVSAHVKGLSAKSCIYFPVGNLFFLTIRPLCKLLGSTPGSTQVYILEIRRRTFQRQPDVVGSTANASRMVQGKSSISPRCCNSSGRWRKMSQFVTRCSCTVLGLDRLEIRRMVRWSLPHESSSRHHNTRERDTGDANVLPGTLPFATGRPKVSLP